MPHETVGSFKRKDHQRHLVDQGEENIIRCISTGRHLGCKNEDCAMDTLFFDLDDKQIDGAVSLFARILHFLPGNNVQLFQHLVAERERRRELRAEILTGGKS